MRDWKFVSECQKRIQDLQPAITRLSCETREEWKQSGMDCSAKKKRLHAVVSELIELTHQNQTFIQTARAGMLAKREQLETAGRNLKLLQQSYIFARPPAWTSFS